MILVEKNTAKSHYFYTAFIVLHLICIVETSNAMIQKSPQQLKIIKNFISKPESIAIIKKVMDSIEENKLGYEDYAQRTGLIWSDVLIKTSDPISILEEYKTRKAIGENGQVTEQSPQSILSYSILQSILTDEIVPKMFESIRDWSNLEDAIFAQIFFQRCSFSEPMEWHQDPGENYKKQADYSLVLMLSDQDDFQYGWSGGEFKIRQGLPEDDYKESDIQTIIPCYNQGIIFNNQQNSHATTEVIPNGQKAKRDIIVIPFNATSDALERIN